MTTTVQVQKVSKAYGGHTVLHSVEFDVRAGEIFGLLGANGSGKTTLLRTIAGAIQPTGGAVVVKGSTGYVAQKFGLYDDLSVEENLRFAARCYGLAGSRLNAAVAESLERFELAARCRTKTGHLSHGWKQRLACAAALSHDPAVLILDEATAGLDAVARVQLWRLLTERVGGGLSIILATHDQEEAGRCHRAGYLREGRLMASDSPESLRYTLSALAHGAVQG